MVNASTGVQSVNAVYLFENLFSCGFILHMQWGQQMADKLYKATDELEVDIPDKTYNKHRYISF